MNHRSEAEKFRAEIAEAKAKVKGLTSQIRHREGRLRRIAADAFNEESEPIDGMIAEVREIVLSLTPCETSPIGVCVCSSRVMSIPGQREAEAWREKHDHTTAEDITDKWRPATHTDACLFCGKTDPTSRLSVATSRRAARLEDR